jgi:hypothetical protein
MSDEQLEDYTVNQGDCIASIAFERGLHPDKIWNHPANSDLTSHRTTGYLLTPGETLKIPRKEIREETHAIDKRHRFKRKGVPEKLILQFLEDDEPRAGAEYTLEIDGRPVANGKLDDQGILEAWIQPDAKGGRVLLDGDEETILQLGYLNPREDNQGVEDRLFNLGYYDGICESRTVEEAVAAFQDFSKQEPTGEPGSETCRDLEQSHGC